MKTEYLAVHSVLEAHGSPATYSQNPTEMAQRSYPCAGARVRGRQVSGATDHRLDADRAVRSLLGPPGKVAPQQQGAQLRSILGVPGEPEDVRTEILRINSEARDLSLQVALLVSVLASVIGLLNSFRMRRLPDIAPSATLEGTTLG